MKSTLAFNAVRCGALRAAACLARTGGNRRRTGTGACGSALHKGRTRAQATAEGNIDAVYWPISVLVKQPVAMVAAHASRPGTEMPAKAFLDCVDTKAVRQRNDTDQFGSSYAGPSQ